MNVIILKKMVPVSIVLIVCLWSVSQVNSAEYTFYGYSPACPKNSADLQFGQPPTFMTNELSLKMTLEIDEKGSVRNITSLGAGDLLIVNHVAPVLSRLDFAPAKKGGTNVQSKLPVIVTINPRFKTTMVEFPVEQGSQIKNSKLYFEALREMGVELPSIKRFPPYFCDLKVTDSLKRLPFTLMKLALDPEGKVESTEIVYSKLPAFNTQMQSAAVWAEFTPLRMEKKPTDCGCFLLVTFFPQIQYPTEEINSNSDSVSVWYDKWRVQVLPDTVGLMTSPMPRESQFAELALEKEFRILSGEVFANLIVDTLGNITVRSTDTKKPVYHKAIRSTLKDLKFFPAASFDGTVVEFSGSAKFLFNINNSVNVRFLWLDK